MLSKDQAIAAADALIHRVETEPRTALLVRLYPVLKRVPPDERQALAMSAWSSPMVRRVMAAATLAVVAVALWTVLGWPPAGMDSAGQRPYFLAMMAASLVAPVQYLCIRAFLQREVPRRFPDDQGSAETAEDVNRPPDRPRAS